MTIFESWLHPSCWTTLPLPERVVVQTARRRMVELFTLDRGFCRLPLLTGFRCSQGKEEPVSFALGTKHACKLRG